VGQGKKGLGCDMTNIDSKRRPVTNTAVLLIPALDLLCVPICGENRFKITNGKQ